MNGQNTPQQDAEELGANGQEGAARRWSPPPLLYASAAVHLGAAAALLARPRVWPWALCALAANHAVLAAAGLWPRSQLLGPNWIRLPAQDGTAARVAITIDDGPDPDVTPQVLSQLAAHRALATFFCVGARVERHADLAREIVSRGHAIENHSQRHRHNFSLLGPGGMSAEISRAQDSILRVTGSRPRFFRAPAGVFFLLVMVACSCAWPVGRAAASTPSMRTRMSCIGGWRIRCRTATSCCCTMAMRHAAATASR